MLGSLTNPRITAKLLISPNNFPCGSETRSESHVLFVRESYMSWQLSTTGDEEISVFLDKEEMLSLCSMSEELYYSQSVCEEFTLKLYVCLNLKALSELDLRQKLSASSWLLEMPKGIVV